MEIELLKNLQHEAIVSYYGTQQSDTRIWIFMEYMPGVRVRCHILFKEILYCNKMNKQAGTLIAGFQLEKTMIIIIWILNES